MFLLNDRKKTILILLIATYIISIFFLMRKTTTYSEIDSYVFPILSLEYQGSFLTDESILPFAQRDFPNLYRNINSYQDLRSSKMPITADVKWVPFYFPLYSILCLPIKIILQLLKLNQEKCFFICNISFALVLFLVIASCKSISLFQRVITLLLLFFSPLFLYVTRIGMEVLLFSLVGISIVFLYEKKYKRCALLTAIAGLLNRTTMVIGIVCIIKFFIGLISENKNSSIIQIIKKEAIKITSLAVCFSPFFLAWLRGLLVRPITNKLDNLFETQEYWSRFYSYLFDINLGLFSFAPLLLILGVLITVYNVINKKYDVLYFIGCMFGTIAAYSFNYNINHSMTYCARYVFWTYPMLVLMVVFYGTSAFSKRLFIVSSGVSIVLTTALLLYNSDNYYNSVKFNKLTRKILSTYPQLYNPSYSIFNCRVNHFHGGYSFRNSDGGFISWKYELPIIYSDRQGIRKILISQQEISEFLQAVLANDSDIIWLKKKLEKVGKKEKFISIPPKINIKKSQNYYKNDLIIFYGAAYNANKFIQIGLSEKENSFSWTEGKELYCVIRFPELKPNDQVIAEINLADVFLGKQQVNIKVDGKCVTNKEIHQGENVFFDFILPENKTVEISIGLPDASSPKSLGLSKDSRLLSLAIKTIRFKKKDS